MSDGRGLTDCGPIAFANGHDLRPRSMKSEGGITGHDPPETLLKLITAGGGAAQWVATKATALARTSSRGESVMRTVAAALLFGFVGG